MSSPRIPWGEISRQNGILLFRHVAAVALTEKAVGQGRCMHGSQRSTVQAKETTVLGLPSEAPSLSRWPNVSSEVPSPGQTCRAYFKSMTNPSDDGEYRCGRLPSNNFGLNLTNITSNSRLCKIR